MQVNILHRDRLCVTAPCSAALDTENRAEGWLPQGKAGFPPPAGKGVGKTDGNGCFSFAGRRWVDCGNEDQASGLLRFFKLR